MKKHIPNFITMLNLFSGSLGIVAALQFNRLDCAAYMMAIAAGFDFFDGMAARILRVKSVIGKELDSLADVVSFGVLPGVIVYMLMLGSSNLPSTGTKVELLPFLALIIPVFSALRLAKFNLDERQTSSFIGLPTPANALLLGALPFINMEAGHSHLISLFTGLTTNFYVLAILTIVMSALLVSEIPLFSLKFSNLKFSNNRPQYILVIFGIVSFALFSFASIPIIVMFYIVLSFFFRPKSPESES